MVEVLDNGAIYMLDIQNFIGKSSTEADRKRIYRARIDAEKNALLLQTGQMSEQMSGQTSDKCPDKTTPEIELEIEIERELEIEIEKDPAATLNKKDIDAIISTWNKLGLQQLQAINSNTKRHTMLKARISEYALETVLSAIESINESQFLKGQNNRGWIITFDWFVKPNNFLKVLEGNYIDKGDKNGTHRQSNRDDFEQYRDIGIEL